MSNRPRFTILEHQVLATTTCITAMFVCALGPSALSLLTPTLHFLLQPGWLAATILIRAFAGFTISATAIIKLLPAKCPKCRGAAFIVGTRGRSAIYRCNECGHTCDTTLKLKR